MSQQLPNLRVLHVQSERSYTCGEWIKFLRKAFAIPELRALERVSCTLGALTGSDGVLKGGQVYQFTQTGRPRPLDLHFEFRALVPFTSSEFVKQFGEEVQQDSLQAKVSIEIVDE